MRVSIFTVFVSLLVLPNMSFAESNGIGGFIAVGPAIVPDFEGSEDYELAPLILGRVQWREFFFELQGTRARANVLPRTFLSLGESLTFQAGPTLSYQFERGDVENDRVDRLRDVDAALELGGFVGIEATGVFHERDAVLGRVEVVGDVSDSHEGHLVTLSGSYATPVGERWRVRLGVDSTYASDEYFDTYFSIDPDNAARSGLTTFSADEGFKDIDVGLSLSYAVTERWSVLTGARYARLLGDAADSPIVDSEGSANQFFGGIAVSYRF